MTKIYVKNKNWIKNFDSKNLDASGDFLTETENKFKVYDVFEFKGKRYVCCCSSDNEILVNEINDNHKKDLCCDGFLNEKYVRCPFCGNENYDSDGLAGDSDEEYECGKCGAVLSWEREIEITYTTSLIKAPDIIKLF